MKVVKVVLDGSLESVICSTNNLELVKGDYVVVEIDNILFSGQVFFSNNMNFTGKVIRKCRKKDFETISNNKKESLRALRDAVKIKNRLDLVMNFIDCYYTFDRKQLFFIFVSDSRVDFRQLAKKLAEKYKTRIELRQIGIRDKAKKIGGIGPCGLFLCCNTFLKDFNSVSINMAKNQFLALNPTKINGLCGRLLCCLNYEDEVYTDLKKGIPKIGSEYETDKGKGKIIGIDIFRKVLTIELKDKSTIMVSYEGFNESAK